MSENCIETFIGETIAEMIKHGVMVSLIPEKSITDENDGQTCAGWFDFEKREFHCATGREDWLEIYAHEYCHFTQWKDDYFGDGGESGLMWEWLAGEEYNDEEVRDAIRTSQLCEWDNEKRTIELIKKFNLPIPIELYTKKSNAYIMFYSLVQKHRKWSKPGYATYQNAKIIAKIIGDRILSDTEILQPPDWFIKIADEECFQHEKE